MPFCGYTVETKNALQVASVIAMMIKTAWHYLVNVFLHKSKALQTKSLILYEHSGLSKTSLPNSFISLCLLQYRSTTIAIVFPKSRIMISFFPLK